MKTTHYVYTYRYDGRVIYVGRGTTESHSATYSRARNLAAHSAVHTWLQESNVADSAVDVHVVAARLTLKASKVIEALLIREFGAQDPLLNIVNGAVRDPLLSISADGSSRACKLQLRLRPRRRGPPLTREVRINNNKEAKARYATTPKGKIAAELAAIYRKTEEGSKRNVLGVQITRAKIEGDPYTHLVAKRDALPTFAQWKKTPEGLIALERVTAQINKAGKAKQ